MADLRSKELVEKEKALTAEIERLLPDFASTVRDGADAVLIHQDSFAADYQEVRGSPRERSPRRWQGTERPSRRNLRSYNKLPGTARPPRNLNHERLRRSNAEVICFSAASGPRSADKKIQNCAARFRMSPSTLARSSGDKVCISAIKNSESKSAKAHLRADTTRQIYRCSRGRAAMTSNAGFTSLPAADPNANFM